MTATIPPKRTKRDVIPHPGVYRRSLLQGFREDCPRRTRFDLQAGDVTTGYTNASALLGQAVHLALFHIMSDLKASGEPQIPEQEAVETAYAALVASDLVLPTAEMTTFRKIIALFAQRYTWDSANILFLEDLLYCDITCPDGEVRTFTGRPDMILRVGAGIRIEDYKTGLKKPRTPDAPIPEGEPIRGVEYLSEHGMFQLLAYGFLALKRVPSAQFATLRELPLHPIRHKEPPREATVDRDALEHMERQLGIIMEQLDRGIQEGPKSELWRPKPGSYCNTACSVARSCPIPREMRGIGSIQTEAQERKAAEAWQVAGAQKDQWRDALKARFLETGHGIPLGHGKELRFDGGKGNAMITVDCPDPEPDVPDVEPEQMALVQP